MTEADRNRELAELLNEVRALRRSLDELKRGQEQRLPPDYAVLARTPPLLPPDYAVLVREARPSYAVLARTEPQFLAPSYEVLVRPAGPDDVEGPISR